MNPIPYDAIQSYENERGFGLAFKKGIDPKILMNTIKKIEGHGIVVDIFYRQSGYKN